MSRGIGAIERVDGSSIFLFEVVDCLFSAVDVALVEVVGNFDEGVGCACHSGEHDYVFALVGNKICYVLNTFCGPYAGAAKFHYFHYIGLKIIYFAKLHKKSDF